MTPVRRSAIVIGITAIASAMACDDGKTGGGCPAVNSATDLSWAVCRVRGECNDLSSYSAERIRDDYIGLDHCGGAEGAAFFGWWQVEGRPSRSFEWKGPVRTGGVFPSHGYLATPVECTPADRCDPFPTTTVAVELNGLDGVKPQDDDVFIPLRGHATLDHMFHASATLDDRGDAAGPRATILAEGEHGAKTTDAAIGDTFAWGRYVGAVVRIVEPRSGVLEPIGWVEIKLSMPKRD